MDDKSLQKIGKLIDRALRSIKNQLNTLELKIEAVNKKIDLSQEETIDTLTDLIETGYNNHEHRIQRLEKHASIR
ncbi:MAG: hypothetical protein AAB801_02665 [Patescibacteria group bacterium]